ncbi:MAG: Hsp33 family molecular chaperone HslO [Proteobacteria bacterium]|nr:Hsp33 family molecular chaperone HslO [Pseudomonadota bacterium]
MADNIRRSLTANHDCLIVTVDAQEVLQNLMSQLSVMPSPMLHLAQACLGSLLVQAINDPQEEEKIELQWMTDGPFGTLHARSEGLGKVRGNIQKPELILPQLENSLGQGIFQCRKTKDSLTSQGNVASQGYVNLDLQEYFQSSEQKVCGVGLSVHFSLDESSPNKNNPVKIDRALGYLLHLLPNDKGVDPRRIEAFDRHLKNLGPISEWLLEGNSEKRTQVMAHYLSGEPNIRTLHSEPVVLHCSCSKEKVLRAISLLTARERNHFLKKDDEKEPDYEVRCEFCSKLYKVSPAEVRNLFS